MNKAKKNKQNKQTNKQGLDPEIICLPGKQICQSTTNLKNILFNAFLVEIQTENAEAS